MKIESEVGQCPSGRSGEEKLVPLSERLKKSMDDVVIAPEDLTNMLMVKFIADVFSGNGFYEIGEGQQ